MTKWKTRSSVRKSTAPPFPGLQPAVSSLPKPTTEPKGPPAKIPCVQKPTVPDSIQAPAGEELVFMARATGFQIYVCRPDANGKSAWTLKVPDAELFDEQGKSMGKHFGGPTWQLNDGSQITGKMAAKVDAPDPPRHPVAAGDGDREFRKRQAVRCDVYPAGEHGGRSSTDCRMHGTERGSGVQEQLFRGLLLLRATVDEKCKNLATRRKRVNGGITDKNQMPLLPPFLCVSKVFIPFARLLQRLSADC
jgi:hypothetical protein